MYPYSGALTTGITVSWRVFPLAIKLTSDYLEVVCCSSFLHVLTYNRLCHLRWPELDFEPFSSKAPDSYTHVHLWPLSRCAQPSILLKASPFSFLSLSWEATVNSASPVHEYHGEVLKWVENLYPICVEFSFPTSA